MISAPAQTEVELDDAPLGETLRAAIAARAFGYAAQPIIDLKTATPRYHELLVRFDLDAPTASLIEIAERSGLIADLDVAVVAEAGRLLRGGRFRGLCVNVSAQTLTDPAAALRLVGSVGALGAMTARLVVEITESAEINNLVLANAAIQALRQRGCRVWLDDFGAGFASLPYLQALEVDGVKIDGGYVAAAARSDRDMRLLAGLVAFARELNVETTAERIETRQQAELAARVGATFGQGYLFGRPQALDSHAMETCR
jgi:EAL domain-containing protein (putative c-di-GMP-specific phosphodiesterase class I)